jgi:hypothetical protein
MADEPKNEDELEDTDDENASLGDDVLAEVVGEEEDDADDDTEGFGHIEEKDVKEPSEEEDEEEDDAALEDDAEDVDYDSFDDVDEM